MSNSNKPKSLENEVNIVSIENSRDPRLKQVINFLTNHYGKEYVDRLDIWQQQLDESSNPECEYPINIAAAYRGNEIVAVGVANQLDIGRNKSIGFLAYTAPDQELNSTTDVSKAVKGVEELVNKIAAKKGKENIGFFVESESGKERMYNRIGYKTLENVKYWEPNQEFDTKTGNAKGRRKPLTPMMKLTNRGDRISKDLLDEVIEGIMWFYCPEQKSKAAGKAINYTDQAYEKIEDGYFENQIKEIKESYKNRKEIRLV